MNVTIKLARSFVAVASAGSFTKAAQALHLTQPALTVHIRQLEENLGLQLFERNTKSVTLTAAGRALEPEFRKAIEQWDALVAKARALASEPRGRLRIACLLSLSGTVIPEIVSDFTARNPTIDVEVEDAVWERILELVRSGEVDVGIGGIRNDRPDLETVHLADEPMFVAFQPSHPLAYLPEVRIRDVIQYQLVLVGKHSSLRRAIEAAIDPKDTPAYPIKDVYFSASAIGMVRAGFGVTILPSTAMELRAEPSLRWRPIVDCFRKLAAVTRRGDHSTPALAAFMETLQGRFVADLEPFAKELVDPGFVEEPA